MIIIRIIVYYIGIYQNNNNDYNNNKLYISIKSFYNKDGD